MAQMHGKLQRTASKSPKKKTPALHEIMDRDDIGEDFFIKYKNLSLGQDLNSIKSIDQIRNEKAVHVFFNKLIAQMTQKEIKSLDKQQRRQYTNQMRQLLRMSSSQADIGNKFEYEVKRKL